MNYRTQDRQDRIRHVLERRQPTLAVVMENVHDPHNVAAIMRSCDAVGVPDVHLLYNEEEFPDFTKHGKQSSAGARKWLRTPQHTTVEGCYEHLKARGFRILASRLDGRAASLYDLDLAAPTALVFGNENRGVSDEAAGKADGTFMVPMMGMVQSLNVSVAAAVTLYEALRQRLAAGSYDHCQLPTEELAELARQWLRL